MEILPLQPIPKDTARFGRLGMYCAIATVSVLSVAGFANNAAPETNVLAGAPDVIAEDVNLYAGVPDVMADGVDAYAGTDNLDAIVAIMPHPDDEFQGWSAIQNRPEEKVLIYATRGESTKNCNPDGVEYVGMLAPVPRPEGLGTDSCEKARINATLGFLNGMSTNDSTIPGDFEHYGKIGPLPTLGYQICRTDFDETSCNTVDTLSADVYIDRQGKGTVIMFNGGDGDLTEPEVNWMLKTVRETPEKLGLNPNIRFTELIGASFYNSDYPNCFYYAHPDHLAVTNTMKTNQNMGKQLTSTCATNPEANLSMTVSPQAATSAFGSYPQGEFIYNYGWLVGAGNTPLSILSPVNNQEGSLWHTTQSFRELAVKTVTVIPVKLDKAANATAPAKRLG